MHNHQCQYCSDRFTCEEPRDECFRRFITCNECWFDHNALHWLIFFVAVVVAIFVTIVAYHVFPNPNTKKPAFPAPASSQRF